MNALSSHVGGNAKSDGDIFISELLRLDPRAEYYNSQVYRRLRSHLRNEIGWPKQRIDDAIESLRLSKRLFVSRSRRTISLRPSHPDNEPLGERCCAYCGKYTKKLSRDHVVPRSRGGLDTHDNLVWACVSCNQTKDNRTPAEWATDILNYKRPRPKPMVRLPLLSSIKLAAFRIAACLKGGAA